MAMKDMVLKVKIKADDQASGAIRGTGAAAKGATGGLMAMAGGLVAVSAAAAGIGLILGAIALAAKFMKDSIGIAIEFEDVMIRTKAVTNSTSAEIDKLGGSVRELAASTRFTAVEVANAAQVMAVAGVTIDEMVSEGALENMLQLALIGGVEVPQAAGIAIAAIKGFRLEMEDMGRVNDVMATAMSSSNVTLTQLGESLKFLGPTAAATGISLEESAAAIGKLGDAGIQGSMAGTQLRGAITKLITPSEEARRVIQDLGLNVFKFTPAGFAAQNALKMVSSELDATKSSADSLSAEIKGVTRDMAGMSLSQQRNNLRVMEIRRRAEKQGRELTQGEMKQITDLENRNKDLDISLARSAVTRGEMSLRSKDLKDTEGDLKGQFVELNQTVNDQVQGLTGLVDVLDQLQASGASTAQIMEIFGVRGGGAMLALLGQHDGFKTLVDDLGASEGAAQRMADTIGSSTAANIDTMISALQESMITLGEEFLPVLKDDLIPLLRDDLIPLMKELVPIVKMWATGVSMAVNGMKGAARGFGSGRPGGMMGGMAVGIASTFMADGGLVTKPTQAVVGEAGPEVVIPLDRFEEKYLNDESGVGISIGAINISGVMNADDVQRIISDSLPSVLSQAMRQNSRGAF
jgi:TP901 family phage tail tape measure protein